MDKTSLNIISLLIGAAALFVVLTKINVPELNMPFWGENPFAIKRDIIEGVQTWLFSSLALLAALIQLFVHISGYPHDDRKYTKARYSLIAGLTFISLVIAYWPLTSVGSAIARRSWFPVVVAKMDDLFSETRFVVENDGQRKKSVASSTPNNPRMTNLEWARSNLDQIERLLDVPPETANLKLRVQRLSRYFPPR